MDRDLSTNDAALHSLLMRLTEECDAYISHDERRRVRLWAGSVEGQIAKMRECYQAADVKPTWITPAKIDSYEYQMFGARSRRRAGDAGSSAKSLPRDWYLRLETSCIAPIGDGPDAIVFVPAHAELDDGTPIGGYTAALPLSDTVRESLPISKFAMIKIEPSDRIHLERIGSPDLDISARDLMRALKRGRERQSALYKRASAHAEDRDLTERSAERASRSGDAPFGSAHRGSKASSRDPTRNGKKRAARSE